MDRGFFSNLEIRSGWGRVFYTLMIIALLAAAVVTIFPFIFAFTSGLKTSTEVVNTLDLFPQNPQWRNYTRVWDLFNMSRLFVNSFIIVGGSVIVRVSVAAMAAFSLSKLNPFGGKIIIFAFMVTLMIPSIAYFVPLYTTIANVPIVNVSLVGSYLGLWLPYAVDAFTIFVLKTFFDQIPNDFIDSARVDGASPFQVLRHIILPLSRSILIVVAVLAFVNLWRDFLLPYLVVTDPEMQPITVALFTVVEDYGLDLQMAASFLALLPPLFIAIVLQRYMAVGLTIGGVKG